MSYCRFGPESDVYVYESAAGFECARCTVRPSRWKMLRHLAGHVRAGDKVPHDAMVELAREWLLPWTRK